MKNSFSDQRKLILFAGNELRRILLSFCRYYIRGHIESLKGNELLLEVINVLLCLLWSCQV